MNSVNSLNDNELFDGLEKDHTFSEKYFGISTTKFIVTLAVVISVGVYISFLLFGDNSVTVLFELEEYESYLSQEVVKLKTENAALQKEYFELLELNSQ